MFVVGDDNWRSIEDGKLYPIEVKFGNRPPWEGEATGMVWSEGASSLLLNVDFEGGRAETFISELKQMTAVDVFYNGESIVRLSLRGTFAAMDEVLACQAAMFDASAPQSSNAPFGNGRSNSGDPFR